MKAALNKQRDVLRIEIEGHSVVRALLICLVFIGALLAINRTRHALLLIATAFFLTLSLNAPVYWLSNKLPGKRRGNRKIATIVAFVIVTLALGGFMVSLVPPLVRQTSHFVSSAPQLIAQTEKQNGPVGDLIRKYKLQDEAQHITSQLSGHFDQAGGRAFGVLSRAAGSVVAVLTILVLTFMMLLEGPYWLKLAKELLPERHHERTERLTREMYSVVKGYVNGQVVLAVIAAVVILPVLLALHIDYPIALAGVVLICGLIPLVGHIIGTVIITLVALAHSPFAAAGIAAYYVLYQQVENYIIRPRIQATATNLSPLIVFASAIIGVEFGGLFGALVAIPIAGCGRILLVEYLRRKKEATA
ncbi:MAG TPA: AI-2E family transporter [Candidatus Saccharimonadales bacterium]|nr:AI-2E family transporter [Candidatus Saccharimonadales bacterium]